MRNIIKTLILGVFATGILALAAPALAASPILSASYQGGSVQISVSNANAYSQINLYSRQSSSLWTVVNNVGQTDGNGNFNQVVTLASDGSGNPIQIYVIVGGLQSTTVSVYPNGGGYTGGCTYYGCTTTGGLSLSQTSVNLAVGQSATITASNSYYNNYNTLYISSNSNPNVATASANGTQLNIYGVGSGSTTISVCQSSGSSLCASVYVSVSGGACTYYGCNNGGIISLSPSTLNLISPQTANVSIINSIYGGSGYYISSNSNPNAAGASVSGNTLFVDSLVGGNTTITVCQSGNSSQCASLYVTVNGGSCSTYGCSGSGSLSLSQTSLNLTSPQTASVSIYGNGSYYVSSNSTPNVANASISGNILYVSSLVGGSTTISVCQSSGSSLCASLYVTVNGNGCSYNCGNNALSLNQTSVNLSVGQSVTVSSYNSSSLYVSSNSNPAAVSVSANGNQSIFYGLANGSSTVVLCGTNSSQCASVYVTVNGNNGCTYNCGTGTISFSPSLININLGQSATVNIYNSYSAGSFYISSNSNSSIASASISGSSLYLLAGGVGNTTITVCQNAVSSCGTLYVTVSSVGGNGNSLSLSQTSLNLNLGQNVSITAYGGSSLYVSSNSNPIVASYSVSGNQVNIYGSGVGSTTLNVCSNSGYGCASVYVTVNGTTCVYSGCNNGGSIALSQTSLSLGGGQSAAVTIYGNGSYYVSSNSNSSVASGSLAGNILNVYGSENGTTSIYVCQNGGASTCATLYVTVGGGTGYYGTTNVVLSQTSLNLSIGQTVMVNASGNGGYGYYISTNSNPGAVSASFNGSVLTVYAIQIGNSTLQVCQNGASACASLYVTVGSLYSYNPNPTNPNSGSSLQYPGTGSSSVLGASTYANGELIAEGQTVSIVYRGTKTAFSSASVFTGLGFSFSNVVQVGNSGLPASGHIISSIYTSHPWGTWIKNGATVYFVQELGLIPVPDWATFINNGGSANLIVPANSYDFRLPILSPMTASDSRLQ